MNTENPSATCSTRRNFMKKSALTVAAISLLGQGTGLAQGGQCWHYLSCIANPVDDGQNIQKNASVPYHFERLASAGKSLQTISLGSGTRLRVKMTGQASGPDLYDKAKKFKYTPKWARIEIYLDAVINGGWTARSPITESEDSPPAKNPFYAVDNLPSEQMEAWEEIDTSNGNITPKVGTVRRESFSAEYLLPNSNVIRIEGFFRVAAIPGKVFIGIDSLTTKTNGVTSASWSFDISTTGFGIGGGASWGQLDSSSPLFNNLKFIWQKAAQTDNSVLRTNTIPEI